MPSWCGAWNATASTSTATASTLSRKLSKSPSERTKHSPSGWSKAVTRRQCLLPEERRDEPPPLVDSCPCHGRGPLRHGAVAVPVRKRDSAARLPGEAAALQRRQDLLPGDAFYDALYRAFGSLIAHLHLPHSIPHGTRQIEVAGLSRSG